MLFQQMNVWCNYVWFKLKNFFESEKGAVDIIAIVVMIGIVVLVAVVFKDRLIELVNHLFDVLDTSSEDVIKNAPTEN